jgi:exopolysaccharide biosynthesis polyprenyl glycosylphosphotransferase
VKLLLRPPSQALPALLFLFDVAGAGALYVLVGSLPGWAEPPIGHGREFLVLGLASSLAWPAVVSQLRLHPPRRREGLVEVASRLALAGALATALMFAVAFAAVRPVRPAFVAALGLSQTLVLGGVRLSLLGGLRVLRRLGHNVRNVLVVGTGPRAVRVCQIIARHPQWGLRVVAHVDDLGVPFDPSIPAERVHKLSDVAALMREQVIDEVVIACPRSLIATLEPVVAACADAGVPFAMLTDLFGDYLPPSHITRFDSLAAVTFAPVHHSRQRLAVKRTIDVLGSAAGLLLSAPVVGLAALAIRLTSPGPIVVRQTCCGLNGRRFPLLRLRTTSVDGRAHRIEALRGGEGALFGAWGDTGVTHVGRVLRRFSLDELPQLWNVLRGDMSLVGPRPAMPAEVALYETPVRRRLSMRPGLTCTGQVTGRQAMPYDEWVKLDLDYVDTWSLRNDARILLRALPAALSSLRV